MRALKDHALAHLWVEKPAIMGIVNVTPDSFSDGGKFFSPDKAIEHGLRLLEEGADILDIGGESTRPGAQAVDPSEEIDRVVPVIEGLAKHAKYISIDTRHAATMRAALNIGANIINDISALEGDPKSMSVAAAAKVPVFLMHKQGNSQNMQDNPKYNNIIEDIFQYLQDRIIDCETHRIAHTMVVVDPGIGFGKNIEDNLLILRNIKRFHDLGVPIMLGASRKSFLEKISGGVKPEERVSGSIAAALWGLSQGVQVYRVHDVKETVAAFKTWQAVSS